MYFPFNRFLVLLLASIMLTQASLQKTYSIPTDSTKLATSQNGAVVKLGIYRHYKGLLYQVIGVCRHTETEEDLIYYRSLYGGYEFWVRPLEMFFETVEFEDGRESCPRFIFVEHDQ